jgi:hypothetical protein
MLSSGTCLIKLASPRGIGYTFFAGNSISFPLVALVVWRLSGRESTQ